MILRRHTVASTPLRSFMWVMCQSGQISHTSNYSSLDTRPQFVWNPLDKAIYTELQEGNITRLDIYDSTMGLEHRYFKRSSEISIGQELLKEYCGCVSAAFRVALRGNGSDWDSVIQVK